MKFFSTIVLLVVINLSAFSQRFEGTIDIVKKTHTDTTYYSYTIKKQQIRIDEYDKYKELKKTYLLNLKDSSIFAINHTQKIYMPVKRQKAIEFAENKPEIINTGNYKYIEGYKCYQWRVRDESSNTEIAYWIAQENFDFFKPMSVLWQNIETSFSFFTLLPLNNIAGNMPLLTESRTLLRDEKAIYTVIKIETASIENEKVFTIPETYNMHEVIR
ncbi:MAG: DUF4412 domain-containing protein [Bacteroidales bacterium]